MTQHFIRKAAGWSWGKRAWARLHEPRVISATYGIGYVLIAVLASASVFYPPRTIEAAAGDVLMGIIAGACAIGGVSGIITVALGNWWAERYAVGMILLGLGGYWVMVAYLAATSPGNRFMQLMVLSLALLFLLIRLHWIGSRPFNPRRYRRGRNR